MNVLTLLTGDPVQTDALQRSARTLTGAVGDLSACAARLERTADHPGLRAGWKGPAADAAGRALRRRAHGFASVARALEIAAHALNRAAAALAAAGRRAARAALLAAAAQPALPLPPGPGLARAELELGEAVEQVRQAGTGCAAVLLEAADRCRAVTRGVGAPRSRTDAMRRLGAAAAVAWLSTVPAPTAPPADVARWWAAHTPAEQRRLTADPAVAARIGALDGVPAVARDRANRLLLARRLARWPAGTAADGAAPSGASVAAHAADLRLLDELDRVRLDPVTADPVPVLLLTYEPTAWGGRGRVAVAFGSPDLAAHVAYVVPGLGARVDPYLPGLVDGTWHLFAATRRLAARPDVATVAWLGYLTPDLPEVFSTRRAENGADELARDIAGLRAARGDDQPHVTVVGHSYGSLVGALCTLTAPGAVDDLAVLGSPGVTVDRADDLPLEPGHVWVGAASGDPVSHLSAFGVDPAAQAFGGHRFPAEARGATPPQAQHTHYLDSRRPDAGLAGPHRGRGGRRSRAGARTRRRRVRRRGHRPARPAGPARPAAPDPRPHVRRPGVALARPRRGGQAGATSWAMAGSNARRARPRWLIASLASSESSAEVRCSPSGTKIGS